MARGVQARKILPLLEENGFEESRVKGDHHQFKKPGHPNVVTVAYGRVKEEIPPGTVKSILRSAGLEDKFAELMGHTNKAAPANDTGSTPPIGGPS